MSTPIINTTIRPSIAVSPQRIRQTPRDQTSFSNVLKQGANVLLTGAQVASQIVGTPALTAAISRLRPGSDASGGLNGADPIAAAHDKRMQDDLKLLEMQSKIQQHNRRISMASNVLRAKHETAKSAISNLRA